MTLEEFGTKFVEHFPDRNVFYDHIETDEDEELYPPIILIHETDGVPLHADNRTYWLGIENRIDVYTPDRNDTLRKEIMEFLDDVGIAYDVSFDEFDESLMLFSDSYILTLDEN